MFLGRRSLLSKAKWCWEYREVGYIDGNTSNPTYKEVCYEDTNHAEAVYIEYDKSIISLDKILEEYFKIIDPTYL